MPFPRHVFAHSSPLSRCGSAGLALVATAAALRNSDSFSIHCAESGGSHRRPPGKPTMFVRDPDDFSRKWKKFSMDGLDKLVVIADFDYTLTPAYKPTDDQAASTHGLLMQSEALGPLAKTVARGIFENYYPIEQSATLTQEEKLPFMIEWWTKSHELLIKHRVSKEAVYRAVEESDIVLREGFMEIFDVLARENVPTLIFSAGLYDVIHAILANEYAKTPVKTLPENVHVVSNMMTFDEDGTIVGFDGTLIHSLNKNASALVETEFWKQCQLEKRRNILLLGDSLGDCNMANGLDFNENEIVRIGFLNDGAEEKLGIYLQHFDVVLTHDSKVGAGANGSSVYVYECTEKYLVSALQAELKLVRLLGC